MLFRSAHRLLQLGLPDYFIPQGSQAEMWHELGLDGEGIEEKIRTFNALN